MIRSATRAGLAALAIAVCFGGPVWAQDDDDDKVEKKDKKKDPGYDTKSDEAVALAQKLSIPPNHKDGKVHLVYKFDDVNQSSDWSHKGLQTFAIDEDGGSLGRWNRASDSMYMGAKNSWGLVLHNIELVGDFEINITMELPSGGAVTRNTGFAILLGFKKKPSLGLVWGQQIVKVKKNFSFKRITKRPAEVFRNTAKMKLKIVRKDNELSLKMNGRKIGKRKLKGKELDGKIGFIGKDLQMTIHEVSITGTVNPKSY